MPINTFTCENCGARNNYIVKVDENGEQEIKCSRCDTVATIHYDELPERLQETIADLEENNRAFHDNMEITDSSHETDTVEETIRKVDDAFADAKQVMKAFDDKLMINTDINAIAEQYAPTEPPKAASPTSSKNNDKPSGGFKERIRGAAAQRAREYARHRLKSDWSASDEEVDQIFGLADELIDTCNDHGVDVRDLVTRYRGDLVRIVRNRTDSELGDTLVQMMDSDSFVTLMDLAMKIS